MKPLIRVLIRAKEPASGQISEPLNFPQQGFIGLRQFHLLRKVTQADDSEILNRRRLEPKIALHIPSPPPPPPTPPTNTFVIVKEQQRSYYSSLYINGTWSSISVYNDRRIL